MSDQGGDDLRFSYYEFYPSKSMSIVAAALFGATLIALVALTTVFKVWRRMTPFVFGVLLEVVGYALRWFSIDNPYSRALYIPTLLLIILAPAFMAASEYMIFGYLISLVGEEKSPVRASRVTFIFVFFDVLSLVVQGGGGGLFASDDPNVIKTGRGILIGGLVIQLVAFGIFWIFAVVFQRRIHKAGVRNRNVDALLYTLYLGCFFILVRSIFRCVEFGSSNGNDGFLVTHEEYYYSLEALPVFLACIIFCVSFPGFWLRRIEHDFPTPALVKTPGEESANGTLTGENEKLEEPKSRRRWFRRWFRRS